MVANHEIFSLRHKRILRLFEDAHMMDNLAHDYKSDEDDKKILSGQSY